MKFTKTLILWLIFSALAEILVSAPSGVWAQPSTSEDKLVGLWRAKRWFGPDARGPLTIYKISNNWHAEFFGHVCSVQLNGSELTFDLPNGQGRFRGQLHTGDTIRGAWHPLITIANGGRMTPVTLTPVGANSWRGEIIPFDDVFTFYLLVRKQPDGTLGVVLRNTERDFGALLGATRIVWEGNAVKLYGKPPWQKEAGVIAEGSYDADRDALSLYFSRGGTYDFSREGDQSGFYPRGKSPRRYTYRVPLSLDDGWPTGSVEEVGIDRAGVEKSIQTVIDRPMDSVNAPQVHAILIARHGRLVLEEYFHGEHRDKLHDTRSAAKSLTATIVGAAIEDGAPLELSTPVYKMMHGGQFPEGLEPLKRALTLEHLLTMSSGFYCDDGDPNAPGSEETMENQEGEPDWYKYTLNVPMAWNPGDTAIYCSANPNLALGVVSRATGESPLYTFHRLIGSPMKIKRYGWFTDPAGHPYGGGGVHLLARDFMKLGQLMLNGGTWEGHRILSREFVDRASSPLYRIGNRGYGYLWWCMDYPYGGDTLHAFAALGAGGQVVMVFPKLDLVITSFGGSYSSRGWRYMQQEFIPNHILPAVQ